MEIKDTYRTDDYLFFWDSVFSQWCPCRFEIDGTFYTSAEQYMMIQKAMVFNQPEIAIQMSLTNSPRTVKALGRSIPNFSDEEWDKHKMQIVIDANVAKFSQDEYLKEKLFRFDVEFVEASPEDPIWGIGMYFTDVDCLDKSKWKGQNLLGICINRAKEIIKERE